MSAEPEDAVTDYDRARDAYEAHAQMCDDPRSCMTAFELRGAVQAALPEVGNV